MKRIFGLLIAAVMVLGVSMQADAALHLRGTDTLGYRLIYDDVLNITWYDYTNNYNTWQNQVNWASALTVTFGLTVYDDWRLPSTVDGRYVWGYDGTTTAGYNITSSEMGHLFYTELGNLGYYAIDGTIPQPGWGLSNTGDFQNLQPNLQPYSYWSGTEYAASPNPPIAWGFSFDGGAQGLYVKRSKLYAVAVRPGDVRDVSAKVPEPATMLLLGSGLAGLGLFRGVRRRHG